MRPSWDEYFFNIIEVVKSRSTCLRRQVGALIVRDKQILATGYNGAPSGVHHCETCLRQELGIPSGQRHEICMAVHSEMNAITQASRFGISIDNSIIYTNVFPCILCSKLIINAGIKEIVYQEEYVDDMAKNMLLEAGVKIRQWTKQ